MSATDELRRLLDERGVEWEDDSEEWIKHTSWNDANCWFNEYPDGLTAWGMINRGTPVQAINATLGNDGAERSNDGVDKTRWYELFGTPERAARTIIGKQFTYDLLTQCDDCPHQTDECYEPSGKCVMDDCDALLEWLRGDE